MYIDDIYLENTDSLNLMNSNDLVYYAADFDADQDVDEDDLAIWNASYGIDAGGDANGDGDTDGDDLLTWQREYTGSVVVAVAAVPEITTVVLGSLATAAGLLVRLRAR